MNATTEDNAQTGTSPDALGFTIKITSGPTGAVRDNDWPCIEYGVKIARNGRDVWSGPYRLGVGHVKPVTYGRVGSIVSSFTADEANCSHHWARGVNFKKCLGNATLQASTAAKLAKFQKVAPKLDDVMGSLLSEGSAFFDGETFEDWAANYGYDTDSRKAEATFRECDTTGRLLARAVSSEELNSLREWASNQ